MRENQEQQSAERRIWGYNRYKRISYVNQSLTQVAENGSLDIKWPGKYGVSIQVGHTYLLPIKPIAGIIKFGIDATFMDLTYTRYKDKVELDGIGDPSTSNPGMTGGLPDFDFPVYYPEEEDYDFDLSSLGIHQLQLGVGIGPSINIAPCALLNNKNLQPLRAQIYGHFIPSASVVLYTDEYDEACVSAAFLPQIAAGFSVNYKQFGIGIEGRWGSARYKNLVSTAEFEEDYEYGSYDEPETKSKFKNSSFRVYLNFHF